MSDPVAWLIISNIFKSKLEDALLQDAHNLKSLHPRTFGSLYYRRSISSGIEQYTMLQVFQDDLKHDLANINEL